MSEQGRGRRPPRGIHPYERLEGVPTPARAQARECGRGLASALDRKPKAKLRGAHFASANFSGWTQLEAWLRHAPRGAHILLAPTAHEEAAVASFAEGREQDQLRSGAQRLDFGSNSSTHYPEPTQHPHSESNNNFPTRQAGQDQEADASRAIATMSRTD